MESLVYDLWAAASSLMPEITFAVLNGACVIGLGAQQFPSLKGLIDGHLQFSYWLLGYVSPAGSAPGRRRLCVLPGARFRAWPRNSRDPSGGHKEPRRNEDHAGCIRGIAKLCALPPEHLRQIRQNQHGALDKESHARAAREPGHFRVIV